MNERVDRILWNVRGWDIDEIVLHDIRVLHVEQMDDRCWWIGIDMGDGPDSPYWSGTFRATSRGVMTFAEQENDGIVWPRDEEHEHD